MSTLADKVTAIALVYLGPAAPVFLERQAKMYLHGIHFADLQREHLEKLEYWIRISASILIGKDKAQEFADKIGRL